MARQSTTPVKFNKTTRKDASVLMSSARAGIVVPAGYIPLLPGDSALWACRHRHSAQGNAETASERGSRQRASVGHSEIGPSEIRRA